MAKAKSKQPQVKTQTQVETLPVVVLTADALIALIRRVDALESQVQEIETQAQKNFDYLVEHAPHVNNNGQLVVLALRDSYDKPIEVVLQEVAVPAEPIQ